MKLRGRWDAYVKALAPKMAYSAEKIDPAGNRPESSDEREEFRTRLRSAGKT